jgi:hypothetical protein
MGWTGASRALRSLKSALRVDIGSDIYEAVPAAMAGIGWRTFHDVCERPFSPLSYKPTYPANLCLLTVAAVS